MSLAGLSFHVSAAVALVAALVAVASRESRRSLAGFAIALAALIVPLVQLQATIVAGVVLLASVVVVALLAGLIGVAGGGESREQRVPVGFWLFAGLGLAGFCWVLLATGSRQVVELPPPTSPGVGFGEGATFVSALGDHLVAALLVGLLALCAVIAAVLTLVGEEVSSP